jgi:hypothetical protein
MRFRYKAKIINSVAGLLLAAISLITTQVWAGLHFTDEEIAIWRARKDSGPYKGRVECNSQQCNGLAQQSYRQMGRTHANIVLRRYPWSAITHCR